MRTLFAIKNLKFLTLPLAFLFFFGVGIPFTYGATIFTDNFDGYITGALTNQGGWTCDYPNWSVNTSDSKSSPKSIRDDATQNVSQCKKTGASTTEGSISFWFRTTNCGYGSVNRGSLRFYFTGAPYSQMPSIYVGSTIDNGCEISLSDFSTDYVAMNTFDNWTQVIFRWKQEINNYYYYKFGWGGNEESDWTQSIYQIGTFPTGFDRIQLMGFYPVNSNKFYFDSITEAPEEEPPTPPDFRVYGISPVSGTEVTATSTDFTFGWQGLDPDKYEGFTLNFREKNTGLVVKQKIFFTSATSGVEAIPLFDFEFDKKSDYYLESGGILVSDYYRVEAYNDLVSPDYFLTINFAGLSPVFEMSNFATWYGENSKFATPTAIFTSITGFLAPVFSKLGEFGARTSEFFNKEDAYARGYALGLIFPTFNQYIDEIEVFMGGFPIIKLFLVSLIVLLGIFIIKLIMKFIPFFG